MKRFLGGIALLFALGGAARAQTYESGQVANAFVLELHLSATEFFLPNGSNSSLLFSGTTGGVFVGGKIGRVIIGGSIDVVRLATGTTDNNPGGQSFDNSETALLFLPGVRVDLVRSPDHKVDAFAEFDFGVGHTFLSTSNDMTMSDTSNYRLVYQVGPGVRLWPHPRFAIAAMAGLHGDFQFVSQTMVDRSQAATTVMAQLEVLGAF